MRLAMLTFGKAKAVQCYAYLLAWLIFVSLGLYWYLNHGSAELSTLSQSGFGYFEDKDYDNRNTVGAKEDKSNSYLPSRLGSNKAHIKDDNYGGESVDEGKPIPTQEKPEVDLSSNYAYDALEDETDNIVQEKAPQRLCNPPETLTATDENVQVPDFKLDSIIVLLRHGDRGPLTHVGSRNVSHINCSTSSPEVQNLFKFSTDTLPKLPGYSQFIGPFHTFPKVPPSSQCNLGQLTQLGFAQLFALGKKIRSTYKSTLFNQNYLNVNTNSNSNNNNANGNNNVATSSAMKDLSDSIPIKIISYSTRYRRTFQSLLAFLYGLVGPKYLTQSTSIRESQSITFCFNDCTCRAVDRLKKSAMLKYKPQQSDKQAMIHLVDHLNSILHENNFKKTGTALLDSLLVYFCHKAQLPCRGDGKHQSTKKSWHNLSPRSRLGGKTCVRPEEISRLIRYIEIENEGLKKLSQNRKYYLLSSYGLMREIVNLALKMISTSSTSSSSTQQQNNPSQQQQHFHGAQAAFQQASSLLSSSIMGNNYYPSAFKSAFSKTRVAVFSGHDTTLQIITGALGIFESHPDLHLPPYGSRLIFEFYRKTNVPPNSPRKHYFRVIYNGLAVTNLVSFCKQSLTKADKSSVYNQGVSYNNVANEDILSKAQFCPMENLVRFLHDHYFEAFGNATNFRDACHFL